jgi:cytochrome P450/NADPH-cytochrome P450 reductase
MFDSMKDVASQLVLKWLRHGPSHRIAAASDFTRLTLDTLALCAMDYRFNSFYSERMHAFVEAMVQFLKLSEIRGSTPALFRAFGMGNQKKWTESIQYMRDLSRELVQERRKNPRDTKDLLNAMIIGKDPITGEHMTEESVIDNVVSNLPRRDRHQSIGSIFEERLTL